MKRIPLFFFLCIFLNFGDVLFGKTQPYFVGLGRDCQVAGAFKSFDLRPASLPLDWVSSPVFDGVIKAFDEDFAHFLDPLYLSYEIGHIFNRHYIFGFNHLFPMDGNNAVQDSQSGVIVAANWMEHLPAVQETQGRRIKRLLDLLTSKETIIFVRTHSIPSEAANFVALMKRKFPKLRFYLVVVHERVDLIGDWKLDKVLNFYASKRSGVSDWWAASEWSAIFQKTMAVVSGKKALTQVEQMESFDEQKVHTLFKKIHEMNPNPF